MSDSVLDLPAILLYAKEKNVGVFLWATWYAVSRQMDEVFPLYAKMGVKGFKIDFFDRDDQVVVASTYQIALRAAENKLMVDYHGIYKPTGLQRTYPNVVSFEGVKGLENFKWANEDQPRYTSSIPFIRMVAGPMDYTPGAMRNATQASYRPVNANPMSKGTRCQQLAEYIICTRLFKCSRIIRQPIGRKKRAWISLQKFRQPSTKPFRWNAAWLNMPPSRAVKGTSGSWPPGELERPEDIEINLVFCARRIPGRVFTDGVNADRQATDYHRELLTIHGGEKRKIHLSTGGGFAGRIWKK